MTRLYLLTDYKDRFGLKWKSTPYRSGYDQRMLAESFAAHGYHVEYVPLAEAFTRSIDWRGKLAIYTSSEEVGNHYKTYIEDVVYGLEEAGARLLPRAAFLRAHQNKVFMEMLRECLLGEELTGVKSRVFGTLEELAAALERNEVAMPCVLKPAVGAMSRGVCLAQTPAEAVRHARRLSRTPHRRYEVRDYLRSLKMRGYRRESLHQGKFIVQPLIAGLDGDWKVLVYGSQYWVLKRHVRKEDFRASGSHENYLPGRHSGIPHEVLSFVEEIYDRLDVPHLSVDVAYDGSRPYLFEFQAVYFGTSTHELCDEYFTRRDGQWVHEEKTHNQEEMFALGVAHYLGRRPELMKSSTPSTKC